MPIYRNVSVRSCNDTANNAAHPMSTVILTTVLMLLYRKAHSDTIERTVKESTVFG